MRLAMVLSLLVAALGMFIDNTPVVVLNCTIMMIAYLEWRRKDTEV